MNMNIGERIQHLGFKRWYERTLLESHAYLVSSVLGMIVAFAGLEFIGGRQDFGGISMGVVTATAGAVVVLFGFQRYCQTLVLAQSIGEHATCKQCNVYAAFNVIEAGKPSPGNRPWLQVRCRKCSHEWRI